MTRPPATSRGRVGQISFVFGAIAHVHALTKQLSVSVAAVSRGSARHLVLFAVSALVDAAVSALATVCAAGVFAVVAVAASVAEQDPTLR